MAAATRHQDDYRSVISTGESYNDTDTTTTMKFDVVPALSAGEKMILQLEDNHAAPTKQEYIRIDGSNITGTTITGVERDIYGTGKQVWAAGDEVSNYISAEEFDSKVDRSNDDFSAAGIDIEYYDNGASGTFDRNNGENQKTVLTGAGTAIAFTNLAVGQCCVAEIYAADTYAPDFSAITPVRDGATLTVDAVMVIAARKLADGTVRYTYGGAWAS